MSLFKFAFSFQGYIYATIVIVPCTVKLANSICLQHFNEELKVGSKTYHYFFTVQLYELWP
jgi:hypothetical protein